MKRELLIALILVVWLAVPCLGQGPVTEDFPVLLVAKDRHGFQTVPEGTLIEHAFEIQNNGNRPLVIDSIAESCSCITILSHDKTIPPHARGAISLRLDTTGYGGKEMERSITVKTNDPGQPVTKLALFGTVEKVYTLTPKIAKLVGKSGERISTSVTVIPEPKYPFKILAARAKRGEHFQFRMEKIAMDGRPAFRLLIENKRKETGRYFDRILLTTDSQAAATIRIGVFAHIKETG